MVCWRARAGCGGVTELCRNHGSEIFLLAFWAIEAGLPAGDVMIAGASRMSLMTMTSCFRDSRGDVENDDTAATTTTTTRRRSSRSASTLAAWFFAKLFLLLVYGVRDFMTRSSCGIKLCDDSPIITLHCTLASCAAVNTTGKLAKGKSFLARPSFLLSYCQRHIITPARTRNSRMDNNRIDIDGRHCFQFHACGEPLSLSLSLVRVCINSIQASRFTSGD